MSRDFYARLLDLDVVFECGWYATLAVPGEPSRQLGLVLAEHPSVPSGYGVEATGVLVTIEVDDVDAVHRRASAMGCEMVVSLRDEQFGQRHFMTVDPAGVLVDAVQQIRPTVGFLREVVQWRRTSQ